MRASLLASATASLFLCNRSEAAVSHAPKLYRAQLCGRIKSTFAAWINSVRRYLLPRLEMRPRIERPPVLYCRGTRPSQAPEVAPATKGLSGADRGDKTGRNQRPDARHAHQTLALGLDVAEFFDCTGDVPDALVQVAPVVVVTEGQAGHSPR